jgi:hypothetical protein
MLFRSIAVLESRAARKGFAVSRVRNPTREVSARNGPGLLNGALLNNGCCTLAVSAQKARNDRNHYQGKREQSTATRIVAESLTKRQTSSKCFGRSLDRLVPGDNPEWQTLRVSLTASCCIGDTRQACAESSGCLLLTTLGDSNAITQSV